MLHYLAYHTQYHHSQGVALYIVTRTCLVGDKFVGEVSEEPSAYISLAKILIYVSVVTDLFIKIQHNMFLKGVWVTVILLIYIGG